MMITDSEFIAVAPFNENNDSQVVAVEKMTKRTKKAATIWYDIETFNDEMSAINSIKSEFVKMKTIESLNFHREVFRCSAIKQIWKFQCAAMVCLEYCQITEKNPFKI